MCVIAFHCQITVLIVIKLNKQTRKLPRHQHHNSQTAFRLASEPMQSYTTGKQNEA